LLFLGAALAVIARWHGPSPVLLALAIVLAVGGVMRERWRGSAVRDDELATALGSLPPAARVTNLSGQYI